MERSEMDTLYASMKGTVALPPLLFYVAVNIPLFWIVAPLAASKADKKALAAFFGRKKGRLGGRTLAWVLLSAVILHAILMVSMIMYVRGLYPEPIFILIQPMK